MDSSPESPQFATLIVTATMLNEQTDRRKAYAWACKIVRDALSANGALPEGSLRTVIPLRENLEGMQVKLIFADVSSSTMRDTMIPAFEKVGTVQQPAEQDEAAARIRAKQKAQDAAKRVAAIGDVDKLHDILGKLIDIKKEDDQGQVSRGKKRFAENCVALLDRAARIGAANLRENKDPETADA